MPWRDSSDMDDYDHFQPCFFESEVEEEFYDAPAPGPSLDIWKKFELLPTPPRSPRHEPAAIGGYSSTRDKLEMVSDMLGDCLMDFDTRGGSTSSSEDSQDCNGCTNESGCSRTCCLTQLKSNLIQDCMWSGLSLPQQLAQLEKPCTASITVDVTASIPSLEAECVDPTAVFPFPISRENSMGTDTPSDSDEEEIDVVTVVGEKVPSSIPVGCQTVTAHQFQLQEERRQSVRVLEQPQSAKAASAHVAAMHNYSSQQQQPTALASMLTSSTHSYKRSRQHSHSPHRAVKKFRISLPQNALQSVVQKLKVTGHHHYSKPSRPSSHNSSRSCSDSEDSEGKRAQHNVLERKRRNDLKSSFFRLRDHIPDLCTQEKAAKVVILKRATDYITGLNRTEKRLSNELDQLKRTNEKLKRRLHALQS